MTVIWESFCILLSLQIGQEFNYWALTYHYTVVRQRLHRALDLHCSNAGLFTTENRQPDMVANKIKSTTTPVGFHGHIRHQSPMSRVSSAILSAGLLWSLPHTPQQQQASDINTSLGGHLLDMRSLLPEEKKKKIIYSPNKTAGGPFNTTPQSGSSERAKPASGPFFFLEKWRKLCWLWSPPCFSSSQEWGVQWFL